MADRHPGKSVTQKNIHSPFIKYVTKHQMHLITIGFFLLCISPVFSSWYYGDDAVSRDITTFMQQENRNFIQYIANKCNTTLSRLAVFILPISCSALPLFIFLTPLRLTGFLLW